MRSNGQCADAGGGGSDSESAQLCMELLLQLSFCYPSEGEWRSAAAQQCPDLHAVLLAVRDLPPERSLEVHSMLTLKHRVKRHRRYRRYRTCRRFHRNHRYRRNRRNPTHIHRLHRYRHYQTSRQFRLPRHFHQRRELNHLSPCRHGLRYRQRWRRCRTHPPSQQFRQLLPDHLSQPSRDRHHLPPFHHLAPKRFRLCHFRRCRQRPHSRPLRQCHSFHH